MNFLLAVCYKKCIDRSFQSTTATPHTNKKKEQQQKASTADAQIPQSLFSRVHPPTPRVCCAAMLYPCYRYSLHSATKTMSKATAKQTHTHTQTQSQGLSLVRFASQSEINTNTNKNRNRSTRHSHRKEKEKENTAKQGERKRVSECVGEGEEEQARMSEGDRSDCPTD